MSDLSKIIKLVWSDDNETVEQYVIKVDNKTVPDRITYCTELSATLTYIYEFKGQCSLHHDKLIQLCEAITYIKENITHQEKDIEPIDFFNAVNYFK